MKNAITLLTDFGTADYFVGAVKGAIVSVNPQAVIVDITHEIPPQDIAAGAFTLLAAYKPFQQEQFMWRSSIRESDRRAALLF